MLERVNNPSDLKSLNIDAKNELSQDIRNLILEVVSKNGGHLASNLGVVELTIALLSVFDVPNDKIVFDVGHQCYAYKILTERRKKFKTLRKLEGISGFPKVSESIYDSFNTGHSATSISAILGMARARDLNGDNNKMIAVIGDGALTGGMALEALNDAGASQVNLTVILNDNEMSISQNVGGMNTFLSKLRTKRSYKVSNDSVKKFFQDIPGIGEELVKVASKVKSGIKSLIIPKMFFEDIGFTYLGPVDGHDILALENMLKRSKLIDGPVIIHVLTKKGKGYKFAEVNPENFHSVSPFDIKTGKVLKEKNKDYSKVFGEKLVSLAKDNEKIVAITASMKNGTGLEDFANIYPKRFFDVGIAEQHALTLAGGMASNGLIPVISIYSTFYQRGYDQVIHDIAMQNLGVVMCVDRAGVVGSDGETHQGLFDLAMFKLVPNLVIMSPANFKELECMLEFAVDLGKPVVIRYPRGSENKLIENNEEIKLGKGIVLEKGSDILIIAIGKFVSKALEVANILKEQKVTATVINSRFLKPLDEDLIKNNIKKAKLVVTMEDGIVQGGLGSSVKDILIESNIRVNVESFGYPDEFIKHGSTEELEKIYGLDNDSIVKKINECLK